MQVIHAYVMKLYASLTGKYLQMFLTNILPPSSESDSETLLSIFPYQEFGGVATI
jgi:hypothetical protein